MKELEVKVNELDDRMHELDKTVSNVTLKFDNIEKEQQECKKHCTTRLSSLENTVNNMWSKIILALLGIIGATTGADIYFEGAKHTPFLADLGFYSSSVAAVLLSLMLFYLGFRKRKRGLLFIGAATACLFAVIFMVNQGFDVIGAPFDIKVAVSLLVAAILSFIEVTLR